MLCRRTEPWLYKLDADFQWQSPYPQEKDWEFRDHASKGWLRLLRDGRVVVTKGYAWDGCTPKLCLLDVLFGTPDGAVDSDTGRPKTYYASLVHDVLCQFIPANLPLSRAQVDRCFFLLMDERKFALRHLYYGVVRLFGWFTKPVTRRIRNIRGGHRVEVPA